MAQPVEQQLVALDGMLYFFSRSSNDGVLTVDVTFDLGTNVDTAVVQTQNRVNFALPQLPPEVQLYVVIQRLAERRTTPRTAIVPVDATEVVP